MISIFPVFSDQTARPGDCGCRRTRVGAATVAKRCDTATSGLWFCGAADQEISSSAWDFRSEIAVSPSQLRPEQGGFLRRAIACEHAGPAAQSSSQTAEAEHSPVEPGDRVGNRSARRTATIVSMSPCGENGLAQAAASPPQVVGVVDLAVGRPCRSCRRGSENAYRGWWRSMNREARAECVTRSCPTIIPRPARGAAAARPPSVGAPQD